MTFLVVLYLTAIGDFQHCVFSILRSCSINYFSSSFSKYMFQKFRHLIMLVDIFLIVKVFLIINFWFWFTEDIACSVQPVSWPHIIFTFLSFAINLSGTLIPFWRDRWGEPRIAGIMAITTISPSPQHACSSVASIKFSGVPE